MHEPWSKSRERAEAAFGLTQTQMLSRTKEALKIDAAATARNEKTARLRAMRLEQEAQARAGKSSHATPITE
ncbi:phage anti-repressor protein [Rhizobium tibeticum]|uniref:Uncharacterized protein n=1 Tax=Rhizobium tibeticum TaxID=501024 RepID=A0A1H8HCA9_9HYPH|nr:phage anti-repressor protein [Rhizobium tibeticum]SEH65330.1 hypothetical protein RTCCBAU85039_1614 [Rhizobium tibeticum]SEN53487.1 hypothetical protein SAMN05216228_1005108 [Rhizobium tibeticum]